MNLGHAAERPQPDSERQIFYDVMCTGSPQQGNAQTERRWWCQGLGEGIASKYFMGTELHQGRVQNCAEGWRECCKIPQMHLIALNRVLQNGEDGQLYPKYTLQRSLLKAEAEEARQSREDAKTSV